MKADIEKEYCVVLYSKITRLEDEEYFDDKNESIKYAKKMADENTITSVYELIYEENYESSECIWESE